MSNSQTYEKIIKVKNTQRQLAKKITAIMCYILFFAIWITAALKNTGSLVPILTAGILTTAMLILITWKYLQLEYEYSFWYGRLGIAKIFGKKNQNILVHAATSCDKKKRKAIIDTDIKKLIIIAPATEEYIAKAESYGIEAKVIAVSSERADNVWLAVTGGEDECRVLVFVEADERCLNILKHTNPLSFIKS